MKFNVNDYVSVKLTPLGIEILRDKHKRLYEAVKERVGTVTSLRTPEQYNQDLDKSLDENDGYYKTQLWSIMDTFGHYCGVGMEVPFDTIIKIEDKYLKPDEED